MDSGIGTRLGLFLLRVFVGAKILLIAWEKAWPGFCFDNYATGWLQKSDDFAAWLTSRAAGLRPEIEGLAPVLLETVKPRADVLAYVFFGLAMVVGVALILGMVTRIAAVLGFVLCAAVFLTTWQTGPNAWMAVTNQAFVLALFCFVILISGAGLCGGLDARIRRPKS
jgi:uncharacterized membrane protein YphA (DoxX/SURF4 family)